MNAKEGYLGGSSFLSDFAVNRLLNKIRTVQECDATMLNRITNVGYKK
jgi:hypothetical protein